MLILEKLLSLNNNIVIVCILCLSISFDAISSPWKDPNDFRFQYITNLINSSCSDEDIYIDAREISLGEIYSTVNNFISKDAITEKCYLSLNDLRNYIKNFLYSNQSTIGIQTKADDLFFQDYRARYELQNNVYYKKSGSINNFSYQVQVKKLPDKTIFDESYISFLIKNNFVVKIGKESKWWSPSNETSLIISNSSRPTPGISFSNYKRLSSDLPIIKYAGDIDFEIFINKLERNRHIPNAILFGNRVILRPNKKLSLSLFRVAQFGGKGRTTNSSVIKNMLLGKDTINRNLEFNEQPGNQIAGIDFNLMFGKKMVNRVYGQLVGEDGLDPIIDDRWVGAIFPSKRFNLGGLEYRFDQLSSFILINLEHINTDSGFKNVTYNHNLYKSGYRYKGFPIGANIDADSHSSIISITKYSYDRYLKLKYRKFNLNQNKSNSTIWGDKNIKGNEVALSINKKFNNGYSFEIVSVYREFKKYNDSLFFFKIEKRI